ncbi:lisH domain and HEAT repeat-containing protein KIAA1468 homolog [Agrilus planipennis]|uniref:LisH domain and HEAT repeat-containing protein KIAA1468 homolog n=1 Tax=Agrilus planipennis TaxID=224129 RepID=A0A7F5R7P6_AGRPL|nr:lisH domain and HEAT repeat-containing protein KIAA1468 homolog [Agrilus planipennis]
MANNGSTSSKIVEKHLHYDEIASKLLEDRFLLTALELHTELLESGRELKKLRDFFSNPGNFEHQQETSSLTSRSGSQVTLDSLDLTRFSEDDEKQYDDKVAVLEFELRKAKETINALRNNLTVAIESEQRKPDKKDSNFTKSEEIKPHEQRALNFLINEYLLQYGYKLTSITFADENENQDFDDWDDVGLNTAKPAELLAVYRKGLRQTTSSINSIATQTDEVNSKEEFNKIINKLREEVSESNNKIEILNYEIQQLKEENNNLQKKKDSLKTGSSLDCCLDFKEHANSSENYAIIEKELTNASSSPEHFEIIENTDDSQCSNKDNYPASLDKVSNNGSNETDWTNISLNKEDCANINLDEHKNFKIEGNKQEIVDLDLTDCDILNRKLPQKFKDELFSKCYKNIPKDIKGSLCENIPKGEISKKVLIDIICESLLRIIPNVILNKREEIIPLLVVIVLLSNNSSERDKLLQQLFNLKKKPSEEERLSILSGITAIAERSGQNLVQNEMLPQCWEQLTHKYLERRLLVAESCNVLIPYISSPIRNSLVLSMIQQMLEDREDGVREVALQTLALVIAHCNDPDKYYQCEQLTLATLNDANVIIFNKSIQYLFPSLAQWATDLGKLESSLIKQILHKLNKHIKDSTSESEDITDLSMRLISVLDHLLPFILVEIVNRSDLAENSDKNMTMEMRSELTKLCTTLSNPLNFYSGDFNIGVILNDFDKLIENNTSITWKQLEWFLDNMLPDLLNMVSHVQTSNHKLLHSFISLFLHISMTFGKPFTLRKIRPIFDSHIYNLEAILSSHNHGYAGIGIIPVYLVSVLSYCDDTEELSNVLKRFICALPLCGVPLDCLEIAVKGLCHLGMQDLVASCLWEGIVHQRPLVRAAMAGLLTVVAGECGHTLLLSKVVPAVVTLANDSEVFVKTATIPTLGSLIADCSVAEVRDKACMQLHTFLLDQKLKENHSFIRQLVVTLGSIADKCSPSFRDDIILNHLMSLSAYTAQMPNVSRKVDMVLALLDAFSSVACMPLNKQIISTTLLPGLRNLETVILENQPLLPHKNTILSLIQETENRGDQNLFQSYSEKGNFHSQNVSQGVEEMKNKMSKVFTKSPSTNFQNIFKKK